MTMKQATVTSEDPSSLTPLNLLNPLSYLQALLPSSLKLRFLKEENIHESQGTFCRSSCSFFSMASSCDTFSSRFPGESLQPRHNRSHTVTECPPFSARRIRLTPRNAAFHYLIELFSIFSLSLGSTKPELIPGGLLHQDGNNESDMPGIRTSPSHRRKQ